MASIQIINLGTFTCKLPKATTSFIFSVSSHQAARVSLDYVHEI